MPVELELVDVGVASVRFCGWICRCSAGKGRFSAVCVQVALRMGSYELMSLLLRHGANVNYYSRINTTHFPSALQYAMTDEVRRRLRLSPSADPPAVLMLLC